MVSVAYPWYGSECSEEDSDNRDCTESDHRVVLDSAGAINVDDFEDQPCDTGSRTPGVNTTKMLYVIG